MFLNITNIRHPSEESFNKTVSGPSHLFITINKTNASTCFQADLCRFRIKNNIVDKTTIIIYKICLNLP